MADVAPKREEVINVKLADVLNARGLEAEGETIHAQGRPDVLVNLQGIKLVVEGRLENQKKTLFVDAKNRIEQGMCEISLAVCYPKGLYETPQKHLVAELEKTKFDGCLFYYAKSEIKSEEFSAKPIGDLADLIRNAVTLIVDNDVLRDQVRSVEKMMTEVVSKASATSLFFKSDALKARLAKALGINPKLNPHAIDTEEDGEED